jgi:2-hydroxy-3-oxopropionate reductase
MRIQSSSSCGDSTRALPAIRAPGQIDNLACERRWSYYPSDSKPQRRWQRNVDEPDIMNERIGFIGLGAMGRPMAARLLQAGYACSIYARRAETSPALEALGARVCASAEEVARCSDIVCIMVTTTADVEQVLLAEHGVVHGAAAGSLVIVLSTISPLATRRMAEVLAARNIDLIDAPVSGGPGAARDGTLSIMVGASEAAYARAEGLLRHLGHSVVRIGECGCGQIAKACNQLALCVAIEGIAEALALCERLGADPSKVREAMANGLAASRALDVFGARMVAHDYAAGVEARLHHKDLQIVLELAHGLGLSVPAAAVTTQSFNALMGAGAGSNDSAVLLEIVSGRRRNP